MRFLLLHLGTRGGGPQVQVEIANAINRSAADEALVAFDSSSEMRSALLAVAPTCLEVGGERSAGWFGAVRRVSSLMKDTRRIVQFCRKSGIDIVFEPMGHPLQAYVRWRLRRQRIPVITSIHDAVRHAGEESTILSLIAGRDLTDTDGVMTYSSAVAEQLRAQHVPVFETVHGAFGANDSQRARRYPERRVVVGFFGRIEKYKGISRLISAAEILRERGVPIELCIVGRGALSDRDRERLNELEAQVDNRWIAESEIGATIRSFDVLALPYDEASQSGVVGFAWNEGVPIVATPVGGLAEQVQAGGGIVAEELSDVAFADAVAQLVSDPALYAEVSRTQLDAARSAFSWDRVARDIASAGREVLAR
ncbi:glycosyltransferase family 4 protein [Microbacterium sp. NPDC077644]|uniref:glycosyltransferase family 4 protein n=1 Tax=Microbacterium sp. NPDC077644 TaxID=3155055 RepID=UPI00344F235F